MERTCQSQKPAISSLVSAKGPSITVRFEPEKRTRLPLETGLETFGGEQDAGLDQLLIEFSHFGE